MPRRTLYGAASLVVLMMVFAPTASAVAASITLKSPYSGTVMLSNSAATVGCANSATTKAWHFDLKTGRGGGGSNGRADSCKNPILGVGQTSTAANYGGFTIIATLPRVSSSTTNISAAVQVNWNSTLTGTSGKVPSCLAVPGMFSYTYVNWGWNYSKARGFGGYAYIDNYSYIGPPSNYSHNSTYNLAGVPNPFSINSTTLLSIDYGYYVYGDCQAYAQAYLGTYGFLFDRSTGSYAYETGDSVSAIYSAELGVYSQTSYGCYADFYWDGPANVTYGNTTYVCYNNNVTIGSYVYVSSPTYYYSYGSSTLQAWSSTGAVAGAVWFNGPFNSQDRYVLELTVYAGDFVYNSWAKGSSSWISETGSGGPGFKLSSITVS
jgi:hypothetical protein